MILKEGQVFWYEVHYPEGGISETRPVVILEIKDGSPIFATFATITGQGIVDFDFRYDKWKVPIFKWDEIDLEKPSYVKANCVAQVDSSTFRKENYIGQMTRFDFQQVMAKVEEFMESGEEGW